MARLWWLYGCILTLLATTPTFVHSYQCGDCDRSKCTPLPTNNCSGGHTVDSCHCCKLCARVEGQTCHNGGHFGKDLSEERCAEGLVCMINPPTGAHLDEHQAGTCQAPELASAEPFECEQALCDVVFIPDCPKDSLVKVTPPTGQCCPDPPTCQCLPCVNHDLQCPRGQVKVVVFEGQGMPGQCCDIYECKPKEEACADVMCEEDYLLEVPCPQDSVRLPPHVTKNGCCVQSQGCACRAVFECEPVKCPDDQRPEVTSRAMGLPGDCCDTWKCVNMTALTCKHQDLEYKDSESWQFDACTTCHCDSGLTFCEAKQCQAPPHCSWLSVPPGECCPICKGCVTDQGEHVNGATWKQSDCVNCRCEHGQVYCQAQLCAIDCTHPRKVPGECCPVCDSNKTHIALPSHCPSLRGCDIHCSQGFIVDQYGCQVCQCKPLEPTWECKLECPEGFMENPLTGATMCECQSSAFQCPPLHNCTTECLYGLRRDKDGCPKCKCRKCPLFVCTKNCVLGYVHNNKGCQLCKCLAPTTAPPPSTTTQLFSPTMSVGRLCMSIDGQLMEEGQSWHDGCRRCFCYQGREMCALISCPVPQCRYPFIKLGDCCPSCAGEIVHPPQTSHCMTEQGIQLYEGETWPLDECTLCICHDGGMLCEIESCPPVLCHHPIKHRGRCCATCPGEGALQPSGLPVESSSHICLSPSGTIYAHDDTWRVNPCQSCVCRDGQIHCFSQTCPVLECETTTLKKGQCCPTCTDSSTRLQKQCVHAGVEYSEGEIWLLNDCTRCFCVDGQPMCADSECTDLPAECPNLVFVPGICCPLCMNTTTENDKVNTVSMVTPSHDKTHHLATKLKLTLGILLPVIIILVVVVIFLTIILLRKRRARSHDLPDSTSISHFSPSSQGDLFKRRPKSTNLDLQGTDPFLNDKKAPMNDYTTLPGVHHEYSTGVNNEYSTVNEYATLEGVQNHINNEYMPLTGSDNKAAILDSNNKPDNNRLYRYSYGDKTSKALICDNSNNRKSM